MIFLTATQKSTIESIKIITTRPFYAMGLWSDTKLIDTENGNIERRINELAGDSEILTQKHNDHVFQLLENAIERRGKHLAAALERLRIKTTKNGKEKI